MPIDVVTTAYGRPALHALATVVAAAKRDDPLAPVTVVVPSNHVGVAARRLLSSGAAGPVCDGRPGIAGVAFLPAYRLAELLGANRLAAAGRRPVSTPVVAAALRRALRRAPGVFEPVAPHPATETALVAAYAELSDVSPGGRAALAAAGRRAADVVRLCDQARGLLAGGWYDEVDLVAAAIDATAQGPPPAGDLGHVVLHLVQDLTQRQSRLLRAVSDRWPTTAVVALTGVAGADAGVRRSLRRLGIPESGTLGDPQPTTAGPPLAVDPATTRVLTASDADDEVRAAVRAIVEAARQGTPLDRMAVLFGSAEPYGRIVHEHLAAAGIPRNGTAVRPLAASTVGRTLLDLLALADHGFRRSDVLGLLSRSALRLPGGSAAPIGEWERLSREAGVVAGRDDWARLLGRLADGLDARAAKLVSDVELEDETMAEQRRAASEHVRRRAAAARQLRVTVLGLIDELDRAAAEARPWQVRVRWLRRLASRLLGGDRVRQAWPTDERRAADKVDGALDRLAALDGIDDPPPLDVFRRTLALELDADLGRVGRFGEGLLVAPLSFAVGLDLDLVVVLGMAEGTLPAGVHDDSLLPDGERRRAGGELPLRRDRVDRDHRLLRAALAGARRCLLCAPRGDLRVSNERVASRWLLDAVATLLGRPATSDELAALDAEWLQPVPSYAHAVTHARFPATAQDYRLRAGAARAPDALVAAGAAVIEARQSRAFTRFDGNVSSVAVATPVDDTVSSTRLETWASCPHAYFMHHLLRVDPVDDPERQLSISPVDRGSLVHEVLERFVRAVVERPPADRPGPDAAWTAADHAAIAALAEQVCDDYEARGLTGRPVFWRRDRAQILTLVDRFLREDERHRHRERLRPLAAELRFGREGSELGPVEMTLDDGRTLRFSGAVDRIDVADDGTLHVTDYKTGGSRTYAMLSPDDPDQRGTKLQLAVYGQAARAFTGRADAAVRADYWFVSDREGFARKGYAVDDAVLARVGSSLTTIVGGIERGVFPARPDDSAYGSLTCTYCDPDGMGVTDRRRDWERKRHDPAVAPYARMAEPPEDAP